MCVFHVLLLLRFPVLQTQILLCWMLFLLALAAAILIGLHMGESRPEKSGMQIRFDSIG